ncbi:MAG: TonB-dependent siderophore receptor [Mesorhizobium amorphae]|nr:MAG: TonB-dependent siderophore receptor [Mesorhizobium amorphae]
MPSHPHHSGFRALLLCSVATLTLVHGPAAWAQDVLELDTVTVTGDGATGGQGTGEGEANEQKGFVAKRSASATKTNTPLIETPQSVSVVTSDQIERQEVRSIRAATRYTAGVISETTGGADTRFGGFNIRGFDSTAEGTFFDGLRLPSTGSSNFFGLDPYGAERVEILKGPSSVLYGQSGPGGIVSYVSKKPTEGVLREFEVNGGSNGLIEGRFDYSSPLGENSPFALRLTGVARSSENQVDFVEDDRFFFAPSLSWNPDADTSLVVNGQYQRDRAGWGLQFLPASGTVFDSEGRRIPNNRFLGEPDYDDFDTDLGSIGYSFSHRFNETFTVRQNARHAVLSSYQASLYGQGYVDEDAGLIARLGGDTDADLGSFAIDNQVQAEFDTGALGHTVLAGLDYRRTSYSDVYGYAVADPLNVFDPVYGSPITDYGVTFNNKVKQRQTGIYLQDQIKLDKLSLVLGGRYDSADTDSLDRLSGAEAEKGADAFTGRVALIYNFDNGIAPYVTYSESFLPPLALDANGQLLEPEEGRQYEAGIKYEPVGWDASFTAAVFDIERSNVVRYDAVGGTFAARQTGEIRSRGLELEGVMSLNESWNARLAYTHLDVEITRDPDGGAEGKVPVTVPDNTASAWLDYTVRDGSALDGLGAGVGVRYVGESFGNDANTFKVPSAVVWDAVLSFKQQNYDLALNVSNVFDKEYVASCGNDTFYCFYAEGRRVTGKATIKW